MPLPNFLIIGAQKAGTSWLARMLAQHPDVFIHKSEIHFFDKSYNYSKGRDWYERHFLDVENETAIGEKTPDYIWANGIGCEGHLPEVHKNIRSLLPEAKLIAILRDPVERAISAANHIVASSRISPIHSLDDLLVGSKRHLLEPHGVIEYGMYHKLLTAYLELFPASQMLLLIFEEDVIAEPDKGLRKTCDFLNVDSSFAFQSVSRRINPYRASRLRLFVDYYFPILRPITRRVDHLIPTATRRPTEQTIDTLREMYTEDLQKLRQLLGELPRSWKTQPVDFSSNET